MDGNPLPDGYVAYFSIQQQHHLPLAFPNLQKDMKNSCLPDKQPEIALSSKRLVYRWLVCLVKDNVISDMPMEVATWLDDEGPQSLYPQEWKELGMTSWERRMCPWWLDYPVKTIPPSEKTLFTKRQATIQEKRPQDTQDNNVGSSSRHKSRRIRRSETRSKRALDLEQYSVKSDTPFDEPRHGPSHAPIDTQSDTCTKVCIIMADIRKIARTKKCRASKKLKLFCAEHHNPVNTIVGSTVEAATSFICAHFPTSLGVKGHENERTTPQWNNFDVRTVEASFQVSER